MKKAIFILLHIAIPFFACQNQEKDKITNENLSTQNIKPHLQDITSYKGNALILFGEESHGDPHAYLFLIGEKDSKVFTNKSFDIQKAIFGKSSIYTYIGRMRMNKLLACKEKQILDFEICNVDSYSKYYVKIWVSYENMVEIRNKRPPLITDSCATRSLTSYRFGKIKGKDLDFKILELE